ncbi:hypothetical protein [Ramlibacter sp.]|uniref:hypothetical protein n=1 Tax=Ramlibacter sp. TaxID=1917967 RepID=UPI002D318CAA|nr:hypothetical protein [Ramlibacter sp.]HYD77550.1 hypothetical protein [Ramlibacter sp.]
MSSSSSSPVDLDQRPRSYLWADRLGIRLSSSIRGAARKRLYERSLADSTDLPEPLLSEHLGDDARRAWGSFHPSLLGGEYLPERKPGEVEVARIVIASTTMDVTCVYASEADGRVVVRVVDEYEGGTLSDCVSREFGGPLSLRELTDFFLEAWDLTDCLHVNFCEHGYPRDDVHAFVLEASSDFYPEFGRLVHQRIDEWLDTVKADAEDDDD